jgi:hypothetical protein
MILFAQQGISNDEIADRLSTRREIVSRWRKRFFSDTTIWRWLNEDAIRPWQHRCWIFPRDPDFATKAGRILDLYQRLWKGRKLAPDEFVLSADEKTSIQARSRRQNRYLHSPVSR